MVTVSLTPCHGDWCAEVVVSISQMVSFGYIWPGTHRCILITTLLYPVHINFTVLAEWPLRRRQNSSNNKKSFLNWSSLVCDPDPFHMFRERPNEEKLVFFAQLL